MSTPQQQRVTELLTALFDYDEKNLSSFSNSVQRANELEYPIPGERQIQLDNMRFILSNRDSLLESVPQASEQMLTYMEKDLLSTLQYIGYTNTNQSDNPLEYIDPDGRSGDDVDAIAELNEQQSNGRPIESYRQTSPELADIPNMASSGCNFMTYVAVVQEETGLNMTADEIHSLVTYLQSTPNPANSGEMCLTDEMNLRNPDVLMDYAFEMLGSPELYATAGWGAEPGQVPDYRNIVGTTPLGNPHHILENSIGEQLYDPWPTPINLANTSAVNVYIHRREED